MNSTTNLSELEELSGAERTRLAVLAIRLAYDSNHVLPSFIDEELSRLSKQIKIDNAHAVHLRKREAEQQARFAAESYLKGGGSLAQICAAFRVTERTLSRAVARLRARQEVTSE